MKKNRTKALCISLGLVAGFLLAVVVMQLITKRTPYYKGAGWSCSDEVFASDCVPTYEDMLRELVQKHGITCDMRRDTVTEQDYTETLEYTRLHLYSEAFTVRILVSNRGEYGTYSVELYAYGEDGTEPAYADIQPYVELINEFTHRVAYDTKADECPNHFKRLYDECVMLNIHATTYEDYYGSPIRTVGYTVDRHKNGGKYYMGKTGDTSLPRFGVYFSFSGILKPLT